MFKQTTLIAVISGLALIATGACSKDNKPTTLPRDNTHTSPTKRPTPKATKPATGELRHVMLSLRRVHFPFDSSVIGDGSRGELATAADILAKHHDVHIYVEGHADERGTTEYNVALGEARARAVVDYLQRMGVDADQLHVVSYGEDRPRAPGHSTVAWAVNRRVEFSLMRGDVELVVHDGTLIDDAGQVLDPANPGKAPRKLAKRTKRAAVQPR